MNRKYLSPLQSEIQNLSDLIGRLEMGFSEPEFDIYTKIANVCLNVGNMRISIEVIKELEKAREVSTNDK